MLAFFRRQNGRAFFPSLPIAARLSRSWHWADSTNASWDVALQLGWLRSTENSIDFFLLRLALCPLNQRCLGYFEASWIFWQHKMPARNQIHAGIFCEPEGLSPDGGLFYSTNRKSYLTGEPGGLSPSGGKTPANLLSLQYPRAHRARCGVQGFSPAKCQRGIKSTLAFSARRRACRPTAVFSIQLTGSYTRPASRGTCRATAVKPRPTRMSLYVPARLCRAVRGAGL